MALHPVTRVLTRLDTQQGDKSANRFPLSLDSAMIRTMKTILKTLILTPGLAWAAEQLPDTAPPDDAAPQTREKGPAHPMDGEEMDSLYLQSPVELDTSDENRGLNALSAEARYLENEQQEMRQRQAETVRPATVPENTPPPAPPNLIPIRDL